ncbi:hypothetical protein SAMN06297251_10167 [Fulvimarina manganoxydans]|uniref:Uncharacterized protein n=1 Tax=Fulvimarina manganoxydans TaxID=937218 RepID=A0A1W1Y967_9HYPH|nr:hypothetical protein [Fulvimarina manganoxydans]SMC32674.1 hypothetical protein SAMN06297251_10167 [Fulvimarina manganoxydans]
MNASMHAHYGNRIAICETASSGRLRAVVVPAEDVDLMSQVAEALGHGVEECSYCAAGDTGLVLFVIAHDYAGPLGDGSDEEFRQAATEWLIAGYVRRASDRAA